MESTQQDLFIGIMEDYFVLKNNLDTLFPRFTVPKTDMKLPQTGVNA